MRIKGEHLRIPGLGRFRLRRRGGNPYPDGNPVKIPVIHECGKWYARVCCKVEPSPRPQPELVTAMDRNCGQVAVVYSDGSHHIHRRTEAKLVQTRLKQAQRQLARQKKGSNRCNRTRHPIQKLPRKFETLVTPGVTG